MLTDKRIKEAESNVKSYIEDGLLKKAIMDKQVINILLRNAKESLRVADEVYKQNLSELWVIVCSYYAMFYTANAVLRKLGYKVGEKIAHKVTADALIVYARQKLKDSLIEDYENTKEEATSLAGLKADSLIESFDFEKNKRSKIQYTTDKIEKKGKAQTSLERAKEFIEEMRKFLTEKGKTR